MSYLVGVSSLISGVDDAEVGADGAEFKTMFTWRGVGTDRLEQVRVQVAGNRIKASGRIIAAARNGDDAFSVTYELITNDAGATRRLAVNQVRASGASQITISRDEENRWLVNTSEGTVSGAFEGAVHVDLALSPFFNALPFRSLRSESTAGSEIEVPVVYVYLPSDRVEAATLRYRADGDRVEIESPDARSGFTVDDQGFVVDYEGLAERV